MFKFTPGTVEKIINYPVPPAGIKPTPLKLAISYFLIHNKVHFPFSREYIKVTDVIGYVRRSTLNMTNLNTAHKRSTIYNMSGRVVSAYTNLSRRRELYN